MSLAFAVMGMLAESGRYGYQLRGDLEAEFGPEWRIDFGQLYHLLASISRKRWVAVEVQPGMQGPERKRYTLTKKGRRELQRWLAAPAGRRKAGRDHLAVKLRFGIEGTKALAQAVADRRRVLETERAMCETPGSGKGQHTGRWLAAEGRRRQIEAALGWVDTCAAVIGTGTQSDRDQKIQGLVALGSDDPVLQLLVQSIHDRHPELPLSSHVAGSLGGLIALREGRAHIAGIHLLDIETGEYNVPFVKHILPDEPVMLVHLARREQGLMIARRNPKRIRHVRDLGRRGVRLINRQRGAGTRLLLHQRLRVAGIDPRSVSGYDREVPTHGAVAAAIAAGTADVGPGIRAVADAWDLEFISLGFEHYDLAIRRPLFESRAFRPFLEGMHDAAFRRAAEALRGYDVSRITSIVADLH